MGLTDRTDLTANMGFTSESPLTATKPLYSPSMAYKAGPGAPIKKPTIELLYMYGEFNVGLSFQEDESEFAIYIEVDDASDEDGWVLWSSKKVKMGSLSHSDLSLGLAPASFYEVDDYEFTDDDVEITREYQVYTCVPSSPVRFGWESPSSPVDGFAGHCVTYIFDADEHMALHKKLKSRADSVISPGETTLAKPASIKTVGPTFEDMGLYRGFDDDFDIEDSDDESNGESDDESVDMDFACRGVDKEELFFEVPDFTDAGMFTFFDDEDSDEEDADADMSTPLMTPREEQYAFCVRTLTSSLRTPLMTPREEQYAFCVGTLASSLHKLTSSIAIEEQRPLCWSWDVFMRPQEEERVSPLDPDMDHDIVADILNLISGAVPEPLSPLLTPQEELDVFTVVSLEEMSVSELDATVPAVELPGCSALWRTTFELEGSFPSDSVSGLPACTSMSEQDSNTANEDQIFNLNDVEIDLNELAWKHEDLFFLIETRRPKLTINTQLETIIEADSESDIDSAPSIDFADHRGYLKPPSTRRSTFLDSPQQQVRPTLTINTRLQNSMEDDVLHTPSFEGLRGFLKTLDVRDPNFLAEEVADDQGMAHIAHDFFDDSIWRHHDFNLPDMTDYCQFHPELPEIVYHLASSNGDEDELPNAAVIDQNFLWPGRASTVSHRRVRQLLLEIPGEIEGLENEILQFVNWVDDRADNGLFKGYDQMLEDAKWAINLLQCHSGPETDTVLALRLAVDKLQGKTHEEEAKGGIIDPIWRTKFRPNPSDKNEYFELPDDAELALNRLLVKCPSFLVTDDPYLPFCLSDAEHKFAQWSNNPAAVDPLDPDYNMLTYANKVGYFMLEHLKDLTHSCITSFTFQYCSEIRSGNFDNVQKVRTEIIQQMDYYAPSGIAGKSFGDVCKKVNELYSLVTMLECREGDERLQQLQNWKTKLSKWKNAASPSSLQADNTAQYAVNQTWKTAFNCMGQIQSAHEAVICEPEQVSKFMEIECLIWCIWLFNLRGCLVYMKVFVRMIPGSLLPGAEEFVVDSLAWWEAKVYQTMRRVRGGR